MAKAHSRARGKRVCAALAWCAAISLGQLGCTEPHFRDDAGAEGDVDSGEDDGGDAQETRDGSSPVRAGQAGPDAAQHVLDAGVRMSEGGGRDAEQATSLEAGSDTSDAGTSPISDAGGGPTNIPQWALALVGTFAKRSVTFSYDDYVSGSQKPFNTRNVELSLVRIAQNGSQLDLTIQLCGYVVSVQNDNRVVAFKNAPLTPPLKGRIVLGEANHFSSAGEGGAPGTEMLSHLGFDPSSSRTSMCAPGSRRPKFEDQKWITSSAYCQCYGSSIPDDADDCRVIDSDGDGQPGIAANGPSPLSGTFDYVMLFDYAVKIVAGEFSGDPQAAPSWQEVRRQTQSCILADGCGVGNNLLCPGGTTLLQRKAAATTCADFTAGDFGPLDNWPPDDQRNCLMR